ncbi:MAG: TetR/AcrR family transcriptional regulator [Eggerthellaceae bacterium]|nr:TetR/AcrR family transcriptional regulator [Eggerthellaceae bacterium]
MKTQSERRAATRKKITDEFWKMYDKKGLKGITVGALTHNANLNRGTFYEYFSDLDDLLNQVENDLIRDFMGRAKVELQKEGFPNTIPELTRRTLPLFLPNNKRLYMLLGENGDPRFFTKLKNLLMTLAKKMFKIDDTEKHKTYAVSYMIHAMLGILSEWYSNDCDISPEEFLGMAQTLVLSGLGGYMGTGVMEMVPLSFDFGDIEIGLLNDDIENPYLTDISLEF